MAPANKRAKKSLPATPQGSGLSKFFGSKDSEAQAPAEPNTEAKELVELKVGPKVQPKQEPKEESKAEPKAATAEPVAEPKTEPKAGEKKEAGKVSEAQLQLVEEKKRQAQAKKRAREAAQVPVEKSMTPSPAKTTPPTPPVARAPVAETTPEKPETRRRIQLEDNCKFGQLSGTKWEQYHNLYMVRLRQLKAAALEEARAIWSGMVAPDCFMSELSGYKRGVNGSEVVVVGVLFKDLKQRPNVIEEIRELKTSLCVPEAVPKAESWRSENDVLWLEENGMRVQLAAGPETARLATGYVVAVRGSATPDGHFKLAGFCFPRAPATAAPKTALKSGSVVLLSGLAFGSEDAVLATAREKALNFLQGTKIARIVLCGGLFMAKELGLAGMKAALKEADAFLGRLGDLAQLDVMPGHHDPTNLALPQRPMHPQLFQARGSFKSVCNPYSFEAGLSIMGHAGQPVEDLCRVSSLSPLEALVSCLEARHLAPTAPDTLAIQPFADVDPFVMEVPPHVLFSGNCSKAESLWRACPRGGSGTQCICVPAFHLCPAVVLVNDARDVRFEHF